MENSWFLHIKTAKVTNFYIPILALTLRKKGIGFYTISRPQCKFVSTADRTEPHRSAIVTYTAV